MMQIDESDFTTAKFKDEITICRRVKKASSSQDVQALMDELLQHSIYNMLIYLIVTHLEESSGDAVKLIAPAEKAVKNFLENQLTE